jgi:hypothetical protein
MLHQLNPNKSHLLNILALFAPCHPHATNLKNKVKWSIHKKKKKQLPNDGVSNTALDKTCSDLTLWQPDKTEAGLLNGDKYRATAQCCLGQDDDTYLTNGPHSSTLVCVLTLLVLLFYGYFILSYVYFILFYVILYYSMYYFYIILCIVCVYMCTNHCHRVFTQLQLTNISVSISIYRVCVCSLRYPAPNAHAPCCHM